MGILRAVNVRAERIHTVRKTLWIVLGLNLAVAGAKLGYGVVSGSVAMTADGFHSLFDGLSNVIGLLGMAIAARPPDEGHPYGHGKYETYAAAAIGGVLVVVAWEVGRSAIEGLTSGAQPPVVTSISFIVMLVTLAVNIGVTICERRVGKRVGSDLLLADASDTASDIIVSLGVIGSLVAVRLGYPAADPIIALLVALAIVRTAISVLARAEATFSDRARLEADEVCRVVSTVEGVQGCHSVRTRGSMSEVFVDLHAEVDPDATVEEGHRMSRAVMEQVREAFPEVVDVLVHLCPSGIRHSKSE
ncbi:MAG: cation diffusion facilitator family transporter [Gammaproteobacteria bacterium]|nr:cation diffusion facilitator family transporter [Gammaproteobacteria bacterium]